MKHWELENSLPYGAPDYHSQTAYQQALHQLNQLSPLVSIFKIHELRRSLAKAYINDAFLFQTGKAIEYFRDCHAHSIETRLEKLLRYSNTIQEEIKTPVIQVAQMAGQYAKARKTLTEKRNNITLPNYFGDLVNRRAFNAKDRQANPKFLLRGYQCASWTLNLLNQQHPSLFIAHEALHLPFEQALTRQEPLTGKWYNVGMHFPWMNLYNNELNNPHIQYAQRIDNPIGLIIHPNIKPITIAQLINRLNPDNDPGRLSLMCDFTDEELKKQLPRLIATVKSTKKCVLWCAKINAGTDAEIIASLEQIKTLHQAHGSRLNGVHIND